jgi:hypothetical protein
MLQESECPSAWLLPKKKEEYEDQPHAGVVLDSQLEEQKDWKKVTIHL